MNRIARTPMARCTAPACTRTDPYTTSGEARPGRASRGPEHQGGGVEVTVLVIAGCPGAALLDERLAAAAASLPGIRVSLRVIADEAEAAATGMRGSPTL